MDPLLQAAARAQKPLVPWQFLENRRSLRKVYLSRMFVEVSKIWCAFANQFDRVYYPAQDLPGNLQRRYSLEIEAMTNVAAFPMPIHRLKTLFGRSPPMQKRQPCARPCRR